MICVHDFPRGEVLVKVGVMEFWLNTTSFKRYLKTLLFQQVFLLTFFILFLLIILVVLINILSID